MEFAFSIIAGLLIGGYIDGELDTDFPFFTLLGLVGGVTAGLSLLLRTLKLRQNPKDEDHEES